MQEMLTIDQVIRRLSADRLDIHYTVLDDLRPDLHKDILHNNPLVENIIDDLEHNPYRGDITDSHNLELFKISKKCFHSINFEQMIDPLHKEHIYVSK